MKLNQTIKAFLSTTIVSIACIGFIAAAATSALARDEEERPHRHVVTAQRVERPPAPPAPEPQPAPRPPVRQPNNPQNDRPESSDVSLDVEIRI